VDLLRTYVEQLPYHVLSWKLYAALAVCLGLEAAFFVRWRPLLSVGLAQDFVFSVCKRWLFLPMMFANAALYKAFYECVLPAGEWQIARAWPTWAQFTVGWLAADFMVYATHVTMHKVGVLWHFHAMHHSQPNINPLTTHRTHLVEDVFEEAVQYLPLAVLGVGFPTWVGVRAFNWVWSHLVHSNVRWNLGPLGLILVSPQYHRVHHSTDPRHHDRNFAGRFVVWDRIFGTWHPDRNVYPETGLGDATYPVEASAAPMALLRQTVRLYLHPFRAIARERPALLRLVRSRT
jgi:sterol desaturase/sphingolipid hydroxylase (fatty acid hydroxylase superfamily)